MNLSEFTTIEQLAAALKSLDMVTAVPWTNYGGTSTVVGWSSFTTKTILYKKNVKTVFVQFAIQGTSDATTVSFTLPYDVDVLGSGQVFQCLVYGIDNGTPQTLPARLDIPSSGKIFNVYKTLGAAAWTGSSTKGVRGEFHYESS